jgi:hypothetical protein
VLLISVTSTAAPDCSNPKPALRDTVLFVTTVVAPALSDAMPALVFSVALESVTIIVVVPPPTAW